MVRSDVQRFANKLLTDVPFFREDASPISSLLLLYWSRPHLDWVCCAATAIFQLSLLLFLCFA